MCWVNYMTIPIVLKKPLRVYKVGTSTVFGNFISLYQNFVYNKYKVMPTIRINPYFERSYPIACFTRKLSSQDIFYIDEGYHSYLTEERAEYKRGDNEIGIFEIPSGATIYVNYMFREVVSTDIKYLGLLKL